MRLKFRFTVLVFVCTLSGILNFPSASANNSSQLPNSLNNLKKCTLGDDTYWAIGFSSQAYFAYIFENQKKFVFRVLDLKNDEKIFELGLMSEPANTFENALFNHLSVLDDVIKRYKLEPFRECHKPFPLKTKDDSYHLSESKTSGDEIIETFELKLHSKSKGQKTIAKIEGEHSFKSDSIDNETQLGGHFIKSPFEERIAIPVVITDRCVFGFTGDELLFIGATLKGFKFDQVISKTINRLINPDENKTGIICKLFNLGSSEAVRHGGSPKVSEIKLPNDTTKEITISMINYSYATCPQDGCEGLLDVWLVAEFEKKAKLFWYTHCNDDAETGEQIPNPQVTISEIEQISKKVKIKFDATCGRAEDKNKNTKFKEEIDFSESTLNCNSTESILDTYLSERGNRDWVEFYCRKVPIIDFFKESLKTESSNKFIDVYLKHLKLQSQKIVFQNFFQELFNQEYWNQTFPKIAVDFSVVDKKLFLHSLLEKKIIPKKGSRGLIESYLTDSEMEIRDLARRVLAIK